MTKRKIEKYCNSINENGVKMRINKLTPIQRHVIKSAGTGAALTAGLSCASQLYNSVTRKNEMRDLIAQYGGKIPYIKQFLIGTAIYAGTSAVLSGLVAYIANRPIKTAQTPKA